MKFTDFWDICPTPAEHAVLTGDGYRITVLTGQLLRLEYEPENRFRDGATQTVLNRQFPAAAFTVRDREDHLTVETDYIRLEYNKKPFSPEGLSAVLKNSLLAHASVWHFGESEGNLKGTARTLDRADGNRIINFSEGTTEGMLPMEDGIMSMDGFAVLDDSHTMGMDAEGRLTPADGRGMDLYLFAYGHDFKAALRDFYHLSGPVPPVPRFALGNWWSRYYVYTDKAYRELMDRFAAEQVPLSVSVLDMDWHLTDIDPTYGAGWTGYTWNRDLIPDPKDLLDDLHARNLRVTLNDHPADGIRAFEDLYPAMAREMGIDPDSGYPVDFDASSEKFLQAFEKVVLDSFEETGVDFWWIDWQQRGGSSAAGVDPLFVLNHTRWLYDNRRGDVGLTFSRYGGPGSHRYPVGFSGDSCITWDSLAFQPYFTATAANIGYGWWSHDIGGHMLGIRDEELTVRWLQFGVFSPIMRLHSSLSEFLGKEPWNYSMEPCAVMEDFLRLRHRLVPWLYSAEQRAAEESLPILYPVYYDWELTRDLYRAARNEYVFGGEMLAAPIVSPADPHTRMGSATAWLPEGEWVDFFTGMRYPGGQLLKVFRPLSGMPVFVRPGTVIPMDGAFAPDNGCPLPDHIVFRIFAGGDGEGSLREDDGTRPGTPGFRSCETVCSIEEKDGLTIRILPVRGDADLIPADRKVTLEIVGIGPEAPSSADCGFETEYDAEKRTMTLRTDLRPGAGAVLRWDAYPACPAPDRAAMVQKLLLPMHISNVKKDQMLAIALKTAEPQRRLAAWTSLGLPEAVMGALTELECTY